MRSPFIRLLVALGIVLGALLVVANLITFIINAMPGVAWIARFEGIIYAGVLNVVLVIAYYFYVVKFEKRVVVELGTKGATQEFGYGFLLGAALMTTVVCVLWSANFYHVSGLNTWSVLIMPFATMLARSLGEELVFRVIVFRIVEEGMGSWFALLISSAFFGLGHIGNPNATWLSTLAIAVEAGLLLGVVYMITQRIWMAWGVHFAWNFMQGAVFGIEVSGTQQTGLLKAEMSGPELITGGSFGVEASLLTVLLCLGVSFVFLKRTQRNGLFKGRKKTDT